MPPGTLKLVAAAGYCRSLQRVGSGDLPPDCRTFAGCGGVHPAGRYYVVHYSLQLLRFERFFPSANGVKSIMLQRKQKRIIIGLSSCEASVFKFQQKMKCLHNLASSFTVYDLMMIKSVVLILFHSYRYSVTAGERPQCL